MSISGYVGIALQASFSVAPHGRAPDVSVQARVLRLFTDIRDRLNLSMLFITHDLRVAAQVCDSIAVMRRGEIVEFGSTEQVFADPRHGYTRELLASVPGKGWNAPRMAG